MNPALAQAGKRADLLVAYAGPMVERFRAFLYLMDCKPLTCCGGPVVHLNLLTRAVNMSTA